MRSCVRRSGLSLVGLLCTAAMALAQSPQQEINALRKQLEDVRRQDSETKRQLAELQRRLEALEAQTSAPEPPTPAPPQSTALEQALQDLPSTPPAAVPSTALGLPQRSGGGPAIRLLDLSADLLASGGGSTGSDTALQALQGGDHDPRKNGFTLQQLELSLTGAVDPYITGEAHLVFFIDPLDGETHVELEEAFLTTQSLPFALQLKAGFFLTEFGLINPTHPHAWDWLDQPVVHTRFFGPDGMRQAGLRLSWLLPLPWTSEFFTSVQNAHGETMASFLASEEFFTERPIGGRPFVSRQVKGADDLVYLVRWENFWNLSATVSAKLGGSAVFGPNASGADGRTTIYGGDLKVRWRPVQHFRGWPFLLWQTELMRRDYRADGLESSDVDGNPLVLPEQTLRDWGLYTQALYGFSYRWAAGLRFDYSTGHGASLQGRAADPFRDTRYRVSPLLSWSPSEFSRLRLQYNYDHAAHLESRDAHTVWLGVELLYGSHPAHKY
ncbi:MAG: hypothetical protein AB7N91_00570 [Candidatus Tectimicrobiota bacterium]